LDSCGGRLGSRSSCALVLGEPFITRVVLPLLVETEQVFWLAQAPKNPGWLL
jgi:hypothetical protein